MSVLDDCVRSLSSKPSPNVMKCLLGFLKEKRYNQEEVLKSLGNSGIRNLFEWIYSKDIELRKSACLLLCELAFDNSKAQEKICSVMNYSMIKGKVALNRLPKRIESLLKERPDLLKLLKKEENEKLKYWSFPPLDSLTYKSSLDNLFFFPDPLDYVIGFLTVQKTTKNFINTTTSYFSEDFDVSDEESKGKSPARKTRNVESLKEPVNYSPKLYSYANDEMLEPVESPHYKSRSAVSPLKPARLATDSIEASINRIKGALNQLGRPSTTRTYSPGGILAKTMGKVRENSKSPDSLVNKRKMLTNKLQGIIKSPFSATSRK